MVKIVEVGEKIGVMDCPGCGAEVSLKVSRNMNVFTYCTAILGEVNGKKERCYTRHTFGRTASKRVLSEYLQEEALKNVQPEKQQEKPAVSAGEQSAVAGTDAPAAGRCFGAALKHFLTE